MFVPKHNTSETGLYNEGSTISDSSDQYRVPFNWTFGLSKAKITEDCETYDVVQLDKTTLSLTISLAGDEVGGLLGLNYNFPGHLNTLRT